LSVASGMGATKRELPMARRLKLARAANAPSTKGRNMRPLDLGLRILAVLELCASAGCGGSSATDPAPLTYWHDVAPLLNDKCVKCHQPGGIGPFSMLSYDEVAARAPKIAALTKARVMPPYLVTHDGSCGQFEDADALSDAEIDRLQTWAGSKLVEGKRVELTPPRPPALEGADVMHTPVVAPVAAGTPLALYDEYRCFLLDAGLTRDRYITAYEVLPGTPAIVHHVIGFLVDPDKVTRKGKTNAELIQALDGADPERVGWSCFGGAGEGIEEDASPIFWAPGSGPVYYPDDMGVKQRPTDKLVVQVHYNLADPGAAGQTDTTTVKVRYADSVSRPAFFLAPDGFLETLFTQKQPDVLLPRMAAVSYTWKKSLAQMGLGMSPPLEVVAVGPHMHQRGRRSELRFQDAAGRDECAARVEDWNFHWQRSYFYRGPRPRLTAETAIQLTCQYDTSQDEKPVTPGWGTRNEMCLDALMVAPAPM
jgi:hypothetical protein